MPHWKHYRVKFHPDNVWHCVCVILILPISTFSYMLQKHIKLVYNIKYINAVHFSPTHCNMHTICIQTTPQYAHKLSRFLATEVPKTDRCNTKCNIKLWHMRFLCYTGTRLKTSRWLQYCYEQFSNVVLPTLFQVVTTLNCKYCYTRFSFNNIVQYW